ncbi:DUF3696 domain-containing protein [Aquimarina litoralis]|uniref:DUF3696 domain-containing protein n=1 Tax=Aquimarina litoralis TaxID=584605 RepID=UPI001C575362|nr:DUF3696 domain-containing protein [Aquimarina litoralis]MBW1294361.1 DUF3696 domain-containing protein [Aquimarina litoralis]
MFGIKINNYRSFSNQYFDFSRVNILIGENSSGKSSLIKFLLFLKRSAKFTSSSFKFTYELGKFDDFVYGHNNDLCISFDFLFGKEYIEFFNKHLSDKEEFNQICKETLSLKGEDAKIKLTFTFDKNVLSSNDVLIRIENKYFGSVELNRNNSKKENIIEGEQCDIKFYSKHSDKEFILEDVNYEQRGFFSLTNGIDVKSKIEKIEGMNMSIFYHMAFMLISQNYAEDLLKMMSYVNPISSTPERSYDENERQGVLYKVKDISDVVNILSDESLETIVRETLLSDLNKALRFYGILHEVKVTNSSFGPKELKVKVNKGGIWSNIKDVGYGSSLQIPIIFQALVANISGGEIIIIEQPEVHIHPLLQSKFIETLVKIGDKNTYLIETHSSDLIRKLQVLVKNKEYKLNPEAVNIYYFKKTKSISEITKHQINDYGKLIPKFPSGFYDSSVNLVKELF